MFSLPTSTLGLTLGTSATPYALPSAAAPGTTRSTNGHFTVNSYTPSQGTCGILFSVFLTCNSTIPADVYESLDLRLFAADKNVCSKAIKGNDGEVTLRALLGKSVAELSGRVQLSLQLFKGNMFVDECKFGTFDFVGATPSAAAPTAPVSNKKRAREDEGDSVATPSKKAKSELADGGDVKSCRLVIDTNIAELGDLSSWSTAELSERRRLVRLVRRQDGVFIHLEFQVITREEANMDDRNVINCMLPPGPECSSEAFVSSVDIIKALELLVSPPDRRMSIEEKNRVRRNIDTLKPLTLKKGNEGLTWIMGLRSPRPITIAKDVKVFKWGQLEAALTKIMRKYAYQMDGSIVEARQSPRQPVEVEERAPVAPVQVAPVSWLTAARAAPVVTPVVEVPQVAVTPAEPAFFNEEIPAFDFDALLFADFPAVQGQELTFPSLSTDSSTASSSSSGDWSELATPVDGANPFELPLETGFDKLTQEQIEEIFAGMAAIEAAGGLEEQFEEMVMPSLPLPGTLDGSEFVLCQPIDALLAPVNDAASVPELSKTELESFMSALLNGSELGMFASPVAPVAGAEDPNGWLFAL